MQHRILTSLILSCLALSACAPRTTIVELHQEPTRELSYQVRCATPNEVLREIHGHLAEGYAGQANWHMRYDLDLHRSLSGSCTAKRVVLHFSAEVTVPEWQSSGSFEARVLKNWLRFIEALKLHEDGHVQIALGAAQAFVADLRTKGPIKAADCGQLEAMIEQRYQHAIETSIVENRHYDAITGHGRTQGTDVPWE